MTTTLEPPRVGGVNEAHTTAAQRAKQARQERKKLDEEIRTLTEQAVREGTAAGLSSTEIGAACGASSSHIDKIKRDLREGDEQQPQQ